MFQLSLYKILGKWDTSEGFRIAQEPKKSKVILTL